MACYIMMQYDQAEEGSELLGLIIWAFSCLNISKFHNDIWKPYDWTKNL